MWARLLQPFTKRPHLALPLELKFAGFLEACDDVVSYAKTYMAVGFTLDYVTADGSRSNYVSDFIVDLTNGEVWIVETKDREDGNDPGEWERLQQHCADASKLDAGRQYQALPVREEEWDIYSPKHNYTRRHSSEHPFSDKVGGDSRTDYEV